MLIVCILRVKKLPKMEEEFVRSDKQNFFFHFHLFFSINSKCHNFYFPILSFFQSFFHHCNERTALKAFCKRGYRLSLIKRKNPEIFGATTMPESLKKIAKVGFNFFPSFFFVWFTCCFKAKSLSQVIGPCISMLTSRVKWRLFCFVFAISQNFWI